MSLRRISGWVVGVALVALAAPAMADVIDGDWCYSDGRHLSIKGPQIVTPAGHPMQGNYSRHAFDYVVPKPEPGAGQTVWMTLINENTVHLRMAAGNPAPDAPVQTWLRCQPQVSRLETVPGDG
jgi:hypothetical protein